MADAVMLDDLDHKLAAAFPGRIVRKDLVKRLKVGFNVPVYVLEYLLGKYCSTINEEEIRAGLEQVKSAIAERIVHGDQSELVKARLQKSGSLKLIDSHRDIRRKGHRRKILGEAFNLRSGQGAH